MKVERPAPRTIAYFSMEVALESPLPTYSGGLGVLAGDMLRSAADLGLSMVGVTLLHRKGYFSQRLDEEGRQYEEPAAWPVDEFLHLTDSTISVEIEGRQVTVRAWQYLITGASGAVVPVLLLDTDLPCNDPYDRTLTDYLYGGDQRYRLCQEVILGVGGVRMLRVLGYTRVSRFHMNEGHAALLALELFAEEFKQMPQRREDAIDLVKRLCVFTTHTPLPAGHDQFPLDLAQRVLNPDQWDAVQALGCCDGSLNMTSVALHLSDYVNGVTKRHSEVSRTLFSDRAIGSITNGVHSATWTAPAFRTLYDRYTPNWREDSFLLRYALGIPLDAIRQAHDETKRLLIKEVNRLAHAELNEHAFTIGFARRATSYKRPDLLFFDPERLRRISFQHGPVQVIFSGKAHPKDEEGKALIQKIFYWARELAPEVRIAYLPNYDMDLGLLLTSGTDLWLNTPQPPYEASGTSGMKAAHNGVPSLSVLDGWWLEVLVEGVTGWAIGSRDNRTVFERRDDKDAEELYCKLEEQILPLYYGEPFRWAELMRFTIALNASFFNTDRMIHEYVTHAYRDR
ncbi:MAG: alpha-glucan family phosphorylase [Candidatus Methylomirabilis oxygeniifera]|uniref:Alpha-glucan phosphorylase n=1 Tax=Methylomirabilis oxygeniifera TaxID=671143 RepID=D5MEY7_METO1|nr:MAG: alpha-glucan family phosphorylase [Candidatus Methylomirabilis oxyfera]CBE68316.1 Alpha-glucan phosphorylase [Candidatus Methylomirabilis oxyfera]